MIVVQLVWFVAQVATPATSQPALTPQQRVHLDALEKTHSELLNTAVKESQRMISELEDQKAPQGGYARAGERGKRLSGARRPETAANGRSSARTGPYRQVRWRCRFCRLRAHEMVVWNI